MPELDLDLRLPYISDLNICGPNHWSENMNKLPPRSSSSGRHRDFPRLPDLRRLTWTHLRRAPSLVQSVIHRLLGATNKIGEVRKGRALFLHSDIPQCKSLDGGRVFEERAQCQEVVMRRPVSSGSFIIRAVRDKKRVTRSGIQREILPFLIKGK